MAWRFKASKYKNAAPIVPKPETYIRDICVGSYQTYGNNIAASAKFMAFNWDHAGSSLAVLPIGMFYDLFLLGYFIYIKTGNHLFTHRRF